MSITLNLLPSPHRLNSFMRRAMSCMVNKPPYTGVLGSSAGMTQGNAADVILVTVRDEHRLDFILPSREERNVREHLLDANLLVVWEHQTRVEEDVAILRADGRSSCQHPPSPPGAET